MHESSIRVGLIGAGPWARSVTGPVFAAGPDTTLAGVWSRTAANARDAAGALGAPAFADIDALIDACDAVAIAVAPDAQVGLAERAATAGRPLLLEKPLARDVEGAQRIVDAIDAAGVGSLVMLTYRFHPNTAAFVEQARAFGALGGRGCFLSGAFLPGSPYATGWRLESGPLLDVGPHLLDLHELALGPIVDLAASGERLGWVAVDLVHESGATSQASLCCRAAMESRTELELFGPAGALKFDGREGDRRDIGVNLRNAFVAMVRGTPHPADAAHALHLQQLIGRADAQLRG